MPLLTVTAIGADRPGIVAAVTEVLANLGANLEDSSMTILRGHFAMMLIADVDSTPAEVEIALAPVAERLHLVVSVRELSHESAEAPSGSPYVVAVHGADRPGIVATVTAVLAEHGANIRDLSTRLSDSLYVLMCDIDVPGSADALDAELARVAGELGVDIHLSPADEELL